MSTARNKERGLGKFDIHETDREQERQRKTMDNPPPEPVCMHDGLGLERQGERQHLWRTTNGINLSRAMFAISLKEHRALKNNT